MQIGRRTRAAAVAVLACAGGGLASQAGGLASQAGAASAPTHPSTVLAHHTVSGGSIPCVADSAGVRVCHGSSSSASDLRLLSFDRQPLEIYVILPPGKSTKGHYPLIYQGHGWGGSAGGPHDTQFYGPTGEELAKKGYAVVQLTSRGFNDSCGSMPSQLKDGVDCAHGYIRLDDHRYEVHDVQYAIGLLVDEGIVDPSRIGVTGESYGGGLSLALATLKDRIMNADGTLQSWQSHKGTPLHIAAAAPVIPWSDLVYSLLPNGRTTSYGITSATADRFPIGVEKLSFVSGLFFLGKTTGQYSYADSQANLPDWYASINAGEPYDSNAHVRSIAKQIAQYHSSYYLLTGAFGVHREAPAPLLIANGFTDDLFPVDEALRYYNYERAHYPSDPIALLDGDFGHQRANNKTGDEALLKSRIQAFFDHYLKGTGTAPHGATVFVETCPAGKPSGGPLSAATFKGLIHGEVDYSTKRSRAASSAGGDANVSNAIDPIAAGLAKTNACAKVASSADRGSPVAMYSLPASKGKGYTLIGALIVRAKATVSGTYPYLAARLWDVNTKAGTQTLVARGVYRFADSFKTGWIVFQLHPGAWHFAAGHVGKLELLGRDAPYLLPSKGNFTVTISSLRFRLPVHEAPGGSGVPAAVRAAGWPF